MHIALEEAGADYTPYTLDAYNKPPWFVPHVNPLGKVSSTLLLTLAPLPAH